MRIVNGPGKQQVPDSNLPTGSSEATLLKQHSSTIFHLYFKIWNYNAILYLYSDKKMVTISVEKNVWEKVTYQKRQIFCDYDMKILENPRMSPHKNELYTLASAWES